MKNREALITQNRFLKKQVNRYPLLNSLNQEGFREFPLLLLIRATLHHVSVVLSERIISRWLEIVKLSHFRNSYANQNRVHDYNVVPVKQIQFMSATTAIQQSWRWNTASLSYSETIHWRHLKYMHDLYLTKNNAMTQTASERLALTTYIRTKFATLFCRLSRI